MNILAFDTSNKALSVAILQDEQLLAEATLNVKKNHSISLMPQIEFLMASAEMAPGDLDRIVVAEGPGSYTGLRVAVATAKMLAYSLAIELVGVSSLYALAAPAVQKDALIVPLIDARRRNVYAGFYQNNQSVRPDQHIAFSGLLASLDSNQKICFVGEVATFAEEIVERLPNAEIQETLPSAYQIGKVGQRMAPVDVDAFVPEYLKKVEAEENWLKTHQASNQDHYIKRV
ncbi:tRNA (adenosine(37)-N6)-threonylcarbamoyltransferase complex dimerization subunit type 1 TsaB [Streptococcus hongkongensis]